MHVCTFVILYIVCYYLVYYLFICVYFFSNYIHIYIRILLFYKHIRKIIRVWFNQPSLSLSNFNLFSILIKSWKLISSPPENIFYPRTHSNTADNIINILYYNNIKQPCNNNACSQTPLIRFVRVYDYYYYYISVVTRYYWNVLLYYFLFTRV